MSGCQGNMSVLVRLSESQTKVFLCMLRTTGCGVTATCTIPVRHCGQLASVATRSGREMEDPRWLLENVPTNKATKFKNPFMSKQLDFEAYLASVTPSPGGIASGVTDAMWHARMPRSKSVRAWETTEP